MSYYVYAHTKPDQTVFYVGKGTRGRAWSTHGRNTHWQRTVAKYGHKVVLLAEGLTQEQAIEEVEEKFGEDIPGDITETEMFNHARKEIIKSFNGENIGGLYLMESLHNIAIRVKNFLLSNDLIEDVFATDEEIIDFTIDKIRGFAPKRN
jgi:hypothetical protein